MTEPDKDLQRGIGEWDENELVFDYGGKITRKRLLLAGGAAAGAAVAGPLLYTSAYASFPDKGLPYKAHTNVKGTLHFWHFWSSPLRHGAIRAAIHQFNKYYPHVKIIDLPIPSGDLPTKLRAAVAAGQGMPDVVVSDRTIIWIDARAKLYDPLTSFAKRDGFNGKKIFFPFTWTESNVKVGKTTELYGLPFETDIRLLFWNRGLFIDGGLNPSKPPTTWGQLPGYASKLDSSTVATFWPKSGNDLSSWVWANASDWQDKKMNPTVNAARNIQTATWEKTWSDRYGGPSGFRAKITANNQPGRNEFQSGHLALTVGLPTDADFMTSLGVQFRPTKGPKAGQPIYPYWGTGLIPHGPAKGAQPRTFSGGFSLSMPRNKHRSKGQQDAAWEFIKFMALVGQLTFEQFAGNIPTVMSMMKDPYLSKKPQWPATKAALKYGHAKLRNYYDPDFPGDVVPPAEDNILNGKQSPKEALDAAQAQAKTNIARGR